MNGENVSLQEGKRYRLHVLCARGGIHEFATFKVIRDSAKQTLQGMIDEPWEIPGVGKSITLHQFYWLPVNKDSEGKYNAERWTFEFLVNENPIPILAIVAGVAILGGLALVFLTFESVEEIVSSPAGAIALPALSIALLLGVSFFIYRYFFSGSQ